MSQGDSLQALVALKAGPEPEELNAKQLWKLLHMGYAEVSLVQVLVAMMVISVAAILQVRSPPRTP